MKKIERSFEFDQVQWAGYGTFEDQLDVLRHVGLIVKDCRKTLSRRTKRASGVRGRSTGVTIGVPLGFCDLVLSKSTTSTTGSVVGWGLENKGRMRAYFATSLALKGSMDPLILKNVIIYPRFSTHFFNDCVEVRDGVSLIHSVTRLNRNNRPRKGFKKLGEDWLDTNYPQWRDPAAYWNE